jgi:dGTPase
MTSPERPDLARYAAKSGESRGRRYPEDFKDDRPAFERDRDRIIHSAAFRRLEYKTQVFVNHEGDYFRTRLTHTLEVAQIAKGIARRLHLNEELTESLALAHDLGHTPFGHSGEEVLNRLMKDKGGFEHNLQSLRIVEELEDRYPTFKGLNLTWETREGIAKHSAPSPDRSPNDLLREYDPHVVPTLEAQIIGVADEIAYNNHDVDDALEAAFFTLEDLDEVTLCREIKEQVLNKYPRLSANKLKYQMISYMIGFLMGNLVHYTCRQIDDSGIEALDDVRRVNKILVSLDPTAQQSNDELKDFLYTHVYRHYKVERMRLKAERYVTLLFETYQSNPALLPPKYLAKMEKDSKERVICDYIAGMTDRYALDEYKRLFEPYERV